MGIINLEYGMKILHPSIPISGFSPLGAYTSSSTPTEKIKMEVCKYWKDDTDANSYKVILKPINEEDKLRFGYEKFYSMDLKQLIEENICKIVL